MLNFTMGPVQASEELCQIGGAQVPYFRTPEFSAVMLENERLLIKLAKASPHSRAVFLTGSGTAAMEAVVMNLFTGQDRVLVVNGGNFGQRFVDLCQLHQIPLTEIHLACGEALTSETLAPYQGKGFTGFLVNIHETTTGVYYDCQLISDFCRENGLFLAVDAISSFLADPFDMEALGAGVMLTSSQKTLACPPGMSAVVLSPAALERIEALPSPRCMYFDFKTALKNGERGQTPFSPAVGILLQIHARLCQIDRAGGAEYEIQRIHEQAEDFRTRITHLPLKIASNYLSNAMTPLKPLNTSAFRVFQILKDQYQIWICPNGGELTDTLFRVGHLGALTKEDNTVLIQAFEDMQKRGLL